MAQIQHTLRKNQLNNSKSGINNGGLVFSDDLSEGLPNVVLTSYNIISNNIDCSFWRKVFFFFSY